MTSVPDPSAGSPASPSPATPDRREFLRTALAGAALPLVLPPAARALVGPAGAPPTPSFVGPKTQRVILVAFAGGVRSKEVLGTPANVPNLMRIAAAGVTLPNVRCENFGHYGATLSIFTGMPEPMGIRAIDRAAQPTLFEYLRRDAGFAAEDVWLSTSGGDQGQLYAYSTHPQYGREYGASTFDGESLFNAEYKKVLESFGRLRPDSAADQAILERLGRSLDQSRLEGLRAAPDPERLRALERFILDELHGASTMLTGPGAADAKAIRVAHKILKVFRPRVLGITLQAHDVAHQSYNSYVEVIRRNDQELGALWDTVQQDPGLAATTAFFVLPEFGRDKDLNQRNGLDHGDQSEAMTKVFLIAAGPDFPRDKVLPLAVRSVDVCPTVLALLAGGKVGRDRMPAKPIKELWA